MIRRCGVFSGRWWLWLALAACVSAWGQPAGRYAELQRQAAAHYSEQSYSLAHQAWADAAKLGVPEEDRRTLDFYLADSSWRSRPGTAEVAEARRQLEALAAGDGALGAESAESLGDSWLALEGDWDRAWKEYGRALKFWGSSTDLETARVRYLGIVWKATGPPAREGESGRVPVDVLARALQVAPDADDRARAHYFLGRRQAAAGDPFSLRRAGPEFQAAVEAGGETAVYEAALFRWAEWNLEAGGARWGADGQMTLEPDYDRALELFERFEREFPKGSSAYRDRVVARIDEIKRPALELRVDHQFLPGTRPLVHAGWRNVGDVEFTLFRVDLEKDFLPMGRTAPDDWLSAVRAAPEAVVRQWTDPGMKGSTHAPRQRDLKLEAIPEPGTYLLEARGGGRSARALIVMTGSAAIFQAAGEQAVAFFGDAATGRRAAEASARLWRARLVNDRWRWQAVEGAAAKDGLVTFAPPPKGRVAADEPWLLLGRAGPQPVVERGATGPGPDGADPWRVQVFTDRAAYRPGETAHWKVIVRRRAAGGYATPGGELVGFAVTDPRGAKIGEGEVKLTEFGGAWGDLALRADLPLGEYAIEFRRGKERIGGGAVFRLEEYRPPEFKVNVAVAPPARLGGEVEAKVTTESDSGGAVADARVAVEVVEEPLARPSPAENGAVPSLRPDPGRAARVVRSETLRTGPDGTVTVRVPTPLDDPGDRRYTIKARVVDASGREATGQGDVVVTRQGYFAALEPSPCLARPKDLVRVALETRDGNGRPLAAGGVITVARQRWTEVWKDPQGREVAGEALDARKAAGVFPPPGEEGWRPVRREYAGDEVARDELATNAAGEGTYSFRPATPGFYRVTWSGVDGDGPPVAGETSVWVSDSAGQAIGYRPGGVEVIVDPAAPARGGRVPVLVTTDAPNCDVLLVVQAGGELFRAEVLHVDGDARLVELESEPRFVPNVFVTVAAMRGLEFLSDTKEIKFPARRNTLAVELNPGAGEILPGGEGVFRLRVRDAGGRPARGEFALAVTDEAATGTDGAGNPVDFFFGEARARGSEPVGSAAQTPFFGSGPAGEIVAAAGARRDLDGALSPAGRATAETSPPAVRPNFSATAFWLPRVLTNADGEATVKFRYPDSLATWKAVLRGATAGAEFGFAQATMRTTKPLVARLLAPRFLVEGDRVEISGVVNNRTSAAINARTSLDVAGLAGLPGTQDLRIEPNADARATWRLDAPKTGVAKLTLATAAGGASDGVAAEIPVVANGIGKFVGVAGKAAESESAWTLALPAERHRGSESLVVTVTPSLAAAALDALPYLLRYPYGSVEQTMSRFLPAAVTARTLPSLGLDRAAVANRIFRGIEREFLAQASPKAAAGLENLDALVAQGLARLADFQHADGAWGWWKKDSADAFMTAYVVWGLRLAQEAGVAVRSDVLGRGSAWLRAHLVDYGDDPNLQAWMLHALAVQERSGKRASDEERAAAESLWTRRDQLAAGGKALLALAVHEFGDADRARMLVRNLRDGVVRDGAPAGGGNAAVGSAADRGNATVVPTAHWGREGMFRAWQDGGVEATAFALQALLAIEPRSDLAEPAMNWLVKNRRGAQWSNTRDTAIAVLAMNRYLAATKDPGAPASFEILVNGRKAGEAKDATALAGASRFEVDRSFLRDGANEILVRRTAGESPLYVAAQARFFTREQPIPAAGDAISVGREYLRYAPRLTLLEGYRFDRIPWKPGETAATNQRIEVVLTVEAKSDLEYVLVEDLKPAGLETANVRSGEFLEAVGPDGRRVPVYCELRDRRVAFFLRKLPAGRWTIRYDSRTETAGDFSALPVTAQAMYAPEIRANGEGRRVAIKAGAP